MGSFWPGVAKVILVGDIKSKGQIFPPLAFPILVG
jgi:hypothetical protein